MKLSAERRASRAQLIFAVLLPALWGIFLGLGLAAATVDGETPAIVWLAAAVATCCAAIAVITANRRSAERSPWPWALCSVPASLLGPLAILLLLVPGIRLELTKALAHRPSPTRPAAPDRSPASPPQAGSEVSAAVAKLAARGEPKRALEILDQARAAAAKAEDLEQLEAVLRLGNDMVARTENKLRARAERIVVATQQNIRFVTRKTTLARGEHWVDPFIPRRPELADLPPRQLEPEPAVGSETGESVRATGRSAARSAPAGKFGIGIGVGVGVVVAAAAGAAYFGWGALLRDAACSNGGHDAFSVTWSPDGRSIAFDERTASGFHIFRLRLADRRVEQLTHSNCAGEGRPAWSPDGHLIAFPVENGSQAGLYVMAPDGSEKRRLVTGNADTPTWSPDGRSIAYSSHSHLRVVQRDGRNNRLIRTGSTAVFDPAWSPGGKRIAFVGNGSGLYLVSAHGGKPSLVDHDPDAGCPSWSVNDVIAYGSYDIETYRPADDSFSTVLPLPTHNGCASWSPDGRELALVTAPIGSQHGDIYLVDEGGEARRLVYHE